jgi:hypothetical protein
MDGELELLGVESARIEGQAIPAGDAVDCDGVAVWAHRPPQPCDRNLCALGCPSRWSITPHGVDECVERHARAAAHQKEGEKSNLSRPADGERMVDRPDLNRPEDPHQVHAENVVRFTRLRV